MKDNKENNENSEIPKSKDRLRILERIAEYEKAGTFDIDVEDDPPAPTLMPDQIDYERKSLSAKLNRKIAYAIAIKFFYDIRKKRTTNY